jgi:hypothetical protein
MLALEMRYFWRERSQTRSRDTVTWQLRLSRAAGLFSMRR